MLSKVNQILDEQIEQSGSKSNGNTNKQGETNDESNTDSDQTNDANNEDDDEVISVEERVAREEYKDINIPNGFPLPIPADDWYLIQITEEGSHTWEGVFCFSSSLDENIATYEQRLQQDTFKVESTPFKDVVNVHRTTYDYHHVDGDVSGDMIYFINDNGNSCVRVYIEFDS